MDYYMVYDIDYRDYLRFDTYAEAAEYIKAQTDGGINWRDHFKLMKVRDCGLTY